VEHATQLLPKFYLLGIAILMDFHHDRIKVIYKRVVMHSRVSFNSSINAHINYNIKVVIKRKP
jgi:hypothetical protein